jgi:hypothetical protein
VATIPEQHLDRLRVAGLLTSEQFPPKHVAFPDGVFVGKPALVLGHYLPGYKFWWGLDGPMLDAPGLWLHSDGGRWFVTSHDYVPGPGPGDFVNEWATPEEAVADVLDFYFGNSDRMDIKRQAHG